MTDSASQRWFSGRFAEGSGKQLDDRMSVAIFASAFLIRIVYVLMIQEHPGFDQPSMDALYHDKWARAIAAGQPFLEGPYFRAPLYAWLLGGVYWLFGPNYLLPRLLQGILGSASCVVVYYIGRDAFDRRVGALAGFAAATYWILIYFDGELLIPSLIVLLDLLLIWCLLRAVESYGWKLWALSGLLLGLSAIARPNVLLFAPAVAVWILWLRRRQGRPRILPLVAFSLASMAPIAPVTLQNHLAGDPVLVASQGGVNFYIGNNPHSDGTTAIVPGTPGDWWGGYFATIRIAEDAEGRELRPSEVSSYYYGKAVEFWLEQPGAALRLLGRKLAYFWGPWEASNNQAIYGFARTFAPFLTYLPLGFGLVAPFGLLGMALARPRGLQLFPLWGFIVVYMASVVAFFFTARYRVPVVPPLLVFGSFGFWWLLDAYREGRLRALGVGAAALALLALLVNVGFQSDRGAEEAIFYNSLGLDYLAKDRFEEAVAAQERAAELDPEYPKVRLDLGTSYAKAGRLEEAIAQFRIGLALAPGSDRLDNVGMEAALYNNLGSTFYSMGNYEDALVEYQRAAGAESGLEAARTWFNIGSAFQKIDRHEEAIPAFEQSLQLDPTRPKALAALGASLVEVSRFDEAVEAIKLAHAYARQTGDPMAGRYAAGVRHFESLRQRGVGEEAGSVDP